MELSPQTAWLRGRSEACRGFACGRDSFASHSAPVGAVGTPPTAPTPPLNALSLGSLSNPLGVQADRWKHQDQPLAADPLLFL